MAAKPSVRERIDLLLETLRSDGAVEASAICDLLEDFKSEGSLDRNLLLVVARSFRSWSQHIIREFTDPGDTENQDDILACPYCGGIQLEKEDDVRIEKKAAIERLCVSCEKMFITYV